VEIELVEGDTLPLLTGVVTKDDGTPEDIANGWSIELHIDYPTPLVKAATIPIGTVGYFEFGWQSGDLIPGLWPAEIQITSPIGIETYQRTTDDEILKLRISPQIA
jgi:hypothetical protein